MIRGRHLSSSIYLIRQHRSSPARLALTLALLLVAVLLPPLTLAELTIARGSGSASAGLSQSRGAPSDWTYTFKSGESFRQVAGELLKPSASADRLASYNGLRSPSTISAGDQIRIPVSWLRQQPEPARVQGVSGNARIRSAGTGTVRRLTDGQQILAGDTVITHNGMVTVELADGSTIRINPGSSVVFNRLTRYGRTGMTDTRVRLERGGVSNRIKPMVEEGARFEIETPSAIAAVRGTAFDLQTDRNGSHLQVTEGRVAFGPPDDIREIPAGYGASVDRSSPKELRILRLPPAPITRPLPETVSSMPTDLEWQATGAGRYRVDILNEGTGHWIRREQIGNTRISLGGLANGRYQVQVAALMADGTSGMPANVAFQVDLAARAAELLEPADKAEVDSDRPRFRWRYRGDSEKARVEIATDSSFTDVVASSNWGDEDSAPPNKSLKPGQYHWRVVTEAGGNSVATSETRTLTVNGTLPPVRVISANYIDRQVRVFWESNEDASGYLLQLSEDPSFKDVIKEATVDNTTAALRLIPGRRYFVRLRAVTEGPTVGRWGPGRELYVE